MSQFNTNPGQGVPDISAGKGDPFGSKGDDSSAIIINPVTAVVPSGIVTTFQLGVKESISPIITIGALPESQLGKIVNRDGGVNCNDGGCPNPTLDGNVIVIKPPPPPPPPPDPPPPDGGIVGGILIGGVDVNIGVDQGDDDQTGGGGGGEIEPKPIDTDLSDGDGPVVDTDDSSVDTDGSGGEPPRIAVPIAANSVTASNDDPFFISSRSVSQYGIDFGLQSRTVTSVGNPDFGSPLKRNLDTPLTSGLRNNERLASILGSLNVDDFSSSGVVPPEGGPTLPAQSTDGNVLPGVTAGAELEPPNTLARDQPLDVNYLYQTFFVLNIPLFPQVNYFCQRVNLPGFGAASNVEQPTRFSNIKLPETKVTFNNLEVTFLVDKNLNNWREIQEWMKRIYLVKDHTQILPNAKDHVSSANLILLNSAMNPNIQIQIKDIFPVSLSGLDFDSSVTDLTPFTATATFAYTTYEFVDPQTGSSL